MKCSQFISLKPVSAMLKTRLFQIFWPIFSAGVYSVTQLVSPHGSWECLSHCTKAKTSLTILVILWGLKLPILISTKSSYSDDLSLTCWRSRGASVVSWTTGEFSTNPGIFKCSRAPIWSISLIFLIQWRYTLDGHLFYKILMWQF